MYFPRIYLLASHASQEFQDIVCNGKPRMPATIDPTSSSGARSIRLETEEGRRLNLDLLADSTFLGFFAVQLVHKPQGQPHRTTIVSRSVDECSSKT